MIWVRIRHWYYQHGYLAAADNMSEIRKQWEGNELRLLEILEKSS